MLIELDDRHSRECGPRSKHGEAPKYFQVRPLNLHDLEFDDYRIGMSLSSPLFTQEREDAASRRQAYHSPDEGLSSSQSSSVGHFRTGRPVADQFGTTERADSR